MKLELNENGLLFRHHCTTEVKKAHPHSHLDSRERRLIKTEDTNQEEENPQETMATSVEDPMAQKILTIIFIFSLSHPFPTYFG